MEIKMPSGFPSLDIKIPNPDRLVGRVNGAQSRVFRHLVALASGGAGREHIPTAFLESEIAKSLGLSDAEVCRALVQLKARGIIGGELRP